MPDVFCRRPSAATAVPGALPNPPHASWPRHAVACSGLRTAAFALTFGIALAGCAESAPATAATEVSSPPVQLLEAAPSSAAPRAKPETSMRDLAAAAAERVGSVGLQPVAVSIAMDDPSVAAAVGYRPATGDASAQCTLMVFAAQDGTVTTVETSAELLDCSAHPTAAGMAAAIELDVQAQRIALFHQGDKRNARFEFARRADGRWVLAAARFTHPEYDLDADEMRVFSDSVAYPADAREVLVSDYRYALVEPDLQRREVE